MSASTTESTTLMNKEIRIVWNLAGSLLFALAAILGVSFLGAGAFAAPADPVLLISTRWFFGGFVAVCVFVGAICLLAESDWLKTMLAFWLAGNMALYYLGCHWVGHLATFDVYLLPIESAFKLSPGWGRWLLMTSWLGLVVAGLVTYFWTRLRRRLGLADYIKMFCPACGGHVKFAAHDAGQKIPCPHCRKEIKLHQPGNLKMSCFFCSGHIEFPSHAIGEKMPCPHCNMDITLKEPA